MRTFPKYCRHAKEALIELDQNVKHDLPAIDRLDSEGDPLPLRTIDQKWASKYRSEITHRIRKAQDAVSGTGGAITSLNLLRDGSRPELCVKVRGSSSMLLLGCLGDLLRFEKREIQVATFAPDRSSP